MTINKSKKDEVKKIEIKGKENIEKLKKSIEFGDKTKVYPAFEKLEKNDDYVFALGMTNTGNKPLDLALRLSFKEAYDSFSNTIFVNKSSMDSWLNVTKFDVEIPPSEKELKEIMLSIGDGSELKDGTYVFQVKAFYNETIERSSPEKFSESEISVKIS